MTPCETMSTFYLMLNMNTSETGIGSIIILEIQNRLVLLKNKSLNLSDQVLISTFNVHNPHGIKLLTRIRVELSHLLEHKFRQNFQDSLNSFCNCDRHIQAAMHFFLHCSNYSNQRKTFFEKSSNIKRFLLNQNDSSH